MSGKAKDPLRGLTLVQRTVLELRFGIGYDAPYSITHTARILKITVGRVRSLEAKALANLAKRKHPHPREASR